MNEQILIVEDDAVVIKGLEMKFRNAGYKVVAAANGVMPSDPLLLNNRIHDGLSMLHWLRRTLPEARFPVIVHTADTSTAIEERAKEFGVTAVFRKGNATSELVSAVRKALDERSGKQAA